MKAVYSLTTFVGLLAFALSAPTIEPHENGPKITTIEDGVQAYESALARWKSTHNETKLDARDPNYSVFLCNQQNWGEPCINWEFSSGQYGQELQKPFDIWSMGPHQGVWCQYVKYGSCNGYFCNSNDYSNAFTEPGWATAEWWPYESDAFKCWW